MNSKLWACAAVLVGLLVGACGNDESGSRQSSDDKFISELAVDDYWKSLDRAQAIATGHTFCDAVGDAGGGDAAIQVVQMWLNRYGLESGPVLVGAAKRSYCPEADLG